MLRNVNAGHFYDVFFRHMALFPTCLKTVSKIKDSSTLGWFLIKYGTIGKENQNAVFTFEIWFEKVLEIQIGKLPLKFYALLFYGTQCILSI